MSHAVIQFNKKKSVPVDHFRSPPGHYGIPHHVGQVSLCRRTLIHVVVSMKNN
jgi:hypothetical protein